jgi:nicotinamidase-related amidase
MTPTALIIVDMLNDFMDEAGALYCGDAARSITPFIRQRLEKARQKGDLVIYLQDSHAEDDAEFERFPQHCVANTWGSEIIGELRPERGEVVISKRRFSGFYDTPLDQILKDNQVESVEIVGVCTSICVMDTVGGLANRDYPTTIFKQGVADFDPEAHQFALKRMQQIYGTRIL